MTVVLQNPVPGILVEFKPTRGKVRTGTVVAVNRRKGKAKIHLEGDPFPVIIKIDQLTSCQENRNNVGSSTKVRKSRAGTSHQGESIPMTTTRTSAKVLRTQAQNLEIEGWEDMGREQLTKAIKKAKAGESKSKPATSRSKRRTSSKAKPKTRKTTTKRAPARKKAAAKKTAATKRVPAKKAAARTRPAATKAEADYTDPPKGTPKAKEVENPFRKGSNLHVIFPLLVPRGGKRRTLAERLQKKVDLHPYSGRDDEVDTLHYDKRLLLAAQTLRDKHGFAIERKGRGLDGTIRVFIPGSEHDPRSANGKAKGTTRKRAAKKR